MGKFGVLPDRLIKEWLIENERIVPDYDIDYKTQLQPATFEPKIAPEAWEVDSYFNPVNPESIKRHTKGEISDIHEEELSPRNIYLLKFQEVYDLPKNICGFADTKSSIGRNNIWITLASNSEKFDFVPYGYEGDLYAFCESKSFNIMPSEQPLNQIRFFTPNSKVSAFELQSYWKKYPMLYDSEFKPIPEEKVVFQDDGIVMRLNLTSEIPAYKAKQGRKFIELNKKKSYELHKYFHKIKANEHTEVKCDGMAFYIFGTLEGLACPVTLHDKEGNPLYDKDGRLIEGTDPTQGVAFCAQIRDYDPIYGPLHVNNKAGFIDPNFGWADPELQLLGGATVTLEYLSVDPRILKHGQEICSVDYFRLIELPDTVYGAKQLKSSYQGVGMRVQRGPTLGKYFKD